MNKIWIIVIIGLLALFAVGGVAGHKMTKTDAFCSSCHAYEKASWDHGMHPGTGCLDCHTGGFWRDKTKGARKVWLVFTGQVDPHHDRLVSYPEKTMANCIGCHMSEEAAAQMPYYINRHSEYMQAAPYCISCHEPGHVDRMRDKRYIAIRQ